MPQLNSIFFLWCDRVIDILKDISSSAKFLPWSQAENITLAISTVTPIHEVKAPSKIEITPEVRAKLVAAKQSFE